MELCGCRRTSRFAVVALSAVALAACGGGGGGGGSSNQTPAPTVTLTANPDTVTTGSTQLTWSSTNALTCTASGDWSGPRATSGTETIAGLLVTTNYTLSCTGDGGTRQVSITVTVPPIPGVTMSATPEGIRAGATTHLVWSSTDATDCQASDGWSGTKAVSGAEDVGPITQVTSYALTCTGAGGSAMTNVVVNLRPGANVPPTANAGPDQTVLSSAQVQLNATASSDDFSIAARTWSQTVGPSAVLSDSHALFPTFTAPSVAVNTVLTFSLVVTDDEGAVSAPDTVNITVQPVPAQIAVQGQLSYESVPFGGLGGGLNYLAMGYVPLTAEVLVEAIDANTQAVVASGRFAQNYQLTVPSVTNLMLRVTASTSRQAPAALPHWQVDVRDLDDSGLPIGPVYTFTTAAFNSGAGGTHDVQIPSGWNTSGQLIGTRAAAPFAVLDTAQKGLQRVLSVAPNADFPALTIDWSPNNVGGATFFTRNGNNRRIVLSAEVNVDTDEYDPGVILHEFGHYIDDAFARSDSIGGSHTLGDRLDLRVAFGEGLATAFSAMARLNSLYRDSFGVNQHNDSNFDIETDRTLNEGWYSETSTQELLWDLFDGSNEGSDSLSLDFLPLWSVWQGSAHTNTPAATSLFSFMTALKQGRPGEAAAIDALLASESLTGPGMDIYGSTETNNAGSGDVLPVYTTIALGGTTVLRSTNLFGTGNKLSTHRFLKFTLAAQGNVKFDLTEAAGRDPDIEVYRQGVPLAPVMGPANESFTLPNLPADDYVLDIYDCDNAECNATLGPAPTDLTISVTPN
jgi:hypothetical protein